MKLPALALVAAFGASACSPVLPEVRASRARCASAKRVQELSARGTPPQHDAAALGDDVALEACLAQGADPNQIDRHGWPPLRSAAWSGHVRAIEKLLRAGAKVDLPSREDGETPLMAAARAGKLEAARILLDRGASTTARDRRGQTALHHAVDNDAPDIIYLHDGPAPLEEEWLAPTAAPLTALLVARGAALNAADADGETALHDAVMRGALAAARELVAAGADTAARDGKGRTPLEIARVRAGGPMERPERDDRQAILRLLEATPPPECVADTDCIIGGALRSCALPCGACPVAIPRNRAPSAPGQSLDEMMRLCPGALAATCSPCPAPSGREKASCIAGRCQ